MNRLIVFVTSAALALVATSLQGQAISVAQDQAQTSRGSGRITLALHNTPLEVALENLEKQAQLGVTYARRTLPTMRVTVNLANTPVDQAYSEILHGTGLALVKNSAGQYVLSSRQIGSKAQGIISGKVTDLKTGKGVSGATVSLVIDTRGAVTDIDGSYRLSGIAAGMHTVTVRLVGYAKQTKQVAVGEGTTVNVDFKLEPSASVLDQIVVTGTIIATELKAVPNAISVITAKQIEDRGITKIDELFRGDIPGLFALNKGSNASLDEVTMFSRGATSFVAAAGTVGSSGTENGTNPIKTYIDGVEMADSKYLSQIDPSSIERIEIITGPQASTIYGANAINGVMQIFTKRGSTTKPQATLEFRSGVTQNNFSSALASRHVADVSLAGVEGRWNYRIGGSWNYDGAWTPGKRTQRFTASAGGRMDIGKFIADLSLSRRLTNNLQKGLKEQSTTALSTTGVNSTSGSDGALRHRVQTLNSNTFGLTISYNPLVWWSHSLILGSDAYATDEFFLTPVFTQVNDTFTTILGSTGGRTSERYNSTMRLPVSSLATLNLTFGGDHYRTKGSAFRQQQAQQLPLTGSFPCIGGTCQRTRPGKNSGAFVQGQLGIKDALFFTYGVRAEWNPNLGDKSKVLPGKYGISYTRDFGSLSAKLRGSYGRSIRPPNDRQKLGRAMTDPDIIAKFGQYDDVLANVYLGPEHQQGGEGGMELYFGSRGSIVVTRFNQTVDNLIYQMDFVDSVRSLAPSAPVTTNCIFRTVTSFDADGHCYRYQKQYLNVASIRNQGWEMQGSVTFGPVTTRGTYSWTKSRVIGIASKGLPVSNDAQFEVGRPFDYIPEHTWALGFNYARSANTVSLFVNGIGMRYVLRDALSLAADAGSRFHLGRPRMQLNGYRSMGPGYTTADLNASHRFSSRINADIQISNLTNYYQNDYAALYVSSGRQTKAGLKIRM